MKTSLNDPMGQAILDYANTGKNKNIKVCSEICEDDIIPSKYLFRSYDEMPEIEKIALTQCKGNVLDVGAGAGIHSKYLHNKGLQVKSIDTSPLTIDYLKSVGIDAYLIDFFDLPDEKFETILILMNGVGIAGKLSNLEKLLIKAKSLLKKDGKILCDSCDIKYLYEEDDGASWIDLGASYYGDFKFQMKYGEHISDYFDWLYVDFENLEKVATKTGLSAKKIIEEDHQYLVELKTK